LYQRRILRSGAEYQRAFPAHEEFTLSETAHVKLSNYTVEKQFGLVVNSKANDEFTNMASEQRV
tara:strand:- start:383 stop:574 length:192 start_codon:yes stop_codon:yes gene_type:complete